MNNPSFKIIFKTQNHVVFFEINKENNIDADVEVFSSVSDLPSANIIVRSKINEISELEKIENNQRIEIQYFYDEHMEVAFKGIISSVEDQKKGINLVLNIKCISEFIELFSYIPNILDNEKSFKEIIENIINEKKIDGEIIFHQNIAIKNKLFYCRKIPILAIMNNFARINDLSIIFHANSIIEITKRQSLYEDSMGEIYHIGEDEIIKIKKIIQ